MINSEGKMCLRKTRQTKLVKNVQTYLTACVLTACMLSGCDKDDDDNGDGTGINDTDRQFVMMASMSNYAEIQEGQLAAVKAENEGIADYGQMMVTDHTTAGTELKTIATRLGLQAKDSLDQAHVMLMDTLESLSARAFDSVYIRSQVADHQKAISIFQNEAQNGQHQDLKKFATDLLPHLEMHLHHADSLRMAY